MSVYSFLVAYVVKPSLNVFLKALDQPDLMDAILVSHVLSLNLNRKIAGGSHMFFNARHYAMSAHSMGISLYCRRCTMKE